MKLSGLEMKSTGGVEIVKNENGHDGFVYCIQITIPPFLFVALHYYIDEIIFSTK